MRSIRYIVSSKIEKIDPQKNNILVVEGKLVTTAIPINRIDTVLVGRKSDYKLVLHSTHQLEELESGNHLYHYNYTISVDLNLLASELFKRII